MITFEYILKDRTTDKIGRYQFNYENEDEMLKAIDFDMLLTIDEMADCVLDEFSQQDKDDMKSLEYAELTRYHHSVGQDIRNAFGLWLDGNPNVLNHPDDTSMEVMETMWEKLQDNIAGSTVMQFI